MEPYSLLGSGMIEEEGDPNEQASLLRSQGSMPTAALMSLMAPPPAANPGLAAGSAGLAALPGGMGAGRNPYLEQHGRDVNSMQAGQQGAARTLGYLQQNELAAQAQALRQQQMQQQMQLKKQEHEMRREEAALKMNLELVKNDDPNLRMVGARGLHSFFQKNGIEGAEGLLQSFATGRLKPDVLDKALLKVHQGYDDSMLSRLEGMDAQSVRAVREVYEKGNDATKKMLGVPTKKDLVELELKEMDLETKRIERDFPELKGNNERTTALMLAHRKMNSGLGYHEGTDESRILADQAVKMEQLDKEARAEALKLKVMQETEARMIRMQTMRDEASWERFQKEKALQEQVAKDKVKAKRSAGLANAKTLLMQMEALLDPLHKGGFLPTDSGIVEQGRAKAKQGQTPLPVPGYAEPNATVWRQWLDLQGNLVGFERNVAGFIGPRFKEAFTQVIGLSQNPPTREGIRAIIKQMDQQIKAAESVDEEPEWTPTPGQATPALPKGAKMEGGKIISESGKYEWDGKAWINRTR